MPTHHRKREDSSATSGLRRKVSSKNHYRSISRKHQKAHKHKRSRSTEHKSLKRHLKHSNKTLITSPTSATAVPAETDTLPLGESSSEQFKQSIKEVSTAPSEYDLLNYKRAFGLSFGKYSLLPPYTDAAQRTSGKTSRSVHATPMSAKTHAERYWKCPRCSKLNYQTNYQCNQCNRLRGHFKS